MKAILAAATVLFATPHAASAQQARDPAAAIWRQLYIEASDRLVETGAEGRALAAKVAELTKALEEEKAKAKPADSPSQK